MQVSRKPLSSADLSLNCPLNKKSFKLYIALAIHLAWCEAPGILNDIPPGGVSPKNITTKSNNSL